MIILYTKPSCAFTAMVIHCLDELAVPFEERSISEPGIAEELMLRSNNRWTPYLVDTETKKEFYGSEPIVAYLQETYGTVG